MGIVMTTFLTSSFLFPYTPIFLPVLNTKYVMGLCGLVLFVYNNVYKKTLRISQPFLWVLLSACSISIVSLATKFINNTADSTYVSYIGSAVIWFAAAYLIVECIKKIHGKVSYAIITQYLVAVCVGQCIIAMLIDNFQVVETFVLRVFYTPGEALYLKHLGRLYGIGCLLDVAGVRFAGVVVLLGGLIIDLARSRKYGALFVCMGCWGVIAFIGNLIARTTTVGLVISVAYWILLTMYYVIRNTDNLLGMWVRVILIAAVTFGIGCYEYNTNSVMRSHIRFGFEGFFSLVEKGYWETNSNNHLKTMIKWPDNPKTWTIGDGYMEDPSKVEPELIEFHARGEVFYQGTDAGYCRFIFYFGIIGLVLISLYFVTVAAGCCVKYPEYTLVFLLALMLNFLVWMKVTTDVLPVFAMFLATIKNDDTSETVDEQQ